MVGRQFSIEEKSSIIAWASTGDSGRTIAKRIGRPYSAVCRLISASKKLKTFTIPKRKPGSGRPSTVSESAFRVLKRHVLLNPTITAARIKIELPREFGHLSERRIQSILKDKLKMPSRSAAKKPLLTKAMKQKRMAFCKKYCHWTQEQWSHVMFSDESMFKCIRSASTKVRRPLNSDRFDPRYTVKTVKHPAQVMVWGCFTGANGRGGLYFLPKGQMMNGATYKTVLEDHLLHFMQNFGTIHFLHDGTPCHRKKVITELLRNRPFEVIDWPGNSPDLNPIENCWNWMKDKLKEKNTISQSLLIEEIKKLWCTGFPNEYLRKLSDSMPDRIQIVLKNKGEMTKY